MRQFYNIASNAFMELVRQPVFLLLMTTSCCFAVFLAVVPYFGFGDDPTMVKNNVLAVVLLAGLFGAVLNASASVAREIRSGTALAVLSKPIGRMQFLTAKFLGLAGALTLLTYVNLVGALLASRLAYDAYGDVDPTATALFFGAVILAYLVGALVNYFLRRPFVPNAVTALAVLTSLAFLVIILFTEHTLGFSEKAEVDWSMVPATILILFALYVLAGLALACSTRLEVIPTLAICSGLFLLGLMSDYLFGRPAEQGSWWASLCYALVPNLQLFWPADALEPDKEVQLWGYVGRASGYMAGYVGATLVLALALFEDRELN